MPRHKYKVGQTVDFRPGRLAMPASSPECTIVRLLPAEGADLLYRVKCGTEPYDRVAKERELTQT